VIVVDTTVLLHAVGGTHAYAGPSRQLLEAVAAARAPATTTAEVIQEFVHVRARRRGRADAATLGRDAATLLSPLLNATESIVEQALRLYERHERLGAFDAFLAAAALESEAEVVVSGDRAFADVEGLEWVEPSEDGIERLLSARGG